MLVFEPKPIFVEYYNYKIHEFLATEYYDERQLTEVHGEYDLEEELVPFFGNSHLLREDPKKCERIVEDLYNWSDDQFGHHLSYLHLFALYNFLCYMDELLDDDNLRKIYFSGEEEEAALERAWQTCCMTDSQKFKKRDELKTYLQDLYNMIEDCFEDIDFITFPEIISCRIAQGEEVPVDLVGDFAELLPKDILAHYRETHRGSFKLFENIDEVLAETNHKLKYGHDYKLLWAGGEPRQELDVHNYLETTLRASFREGKVQIDREVDTGVGRVDFRLMKNAMDKVLIEVKLASNKKLRDGLLKQLRYYMDAERCDQAYYLIFCFTDQEYERGKKFVADCRGILRKNPKREIVVRIFDVRERATAAKRR